MATAGALQRSCDILRSQGLIMVSPPIPHPSRAGPSSSDKWLGWRLAGAICWEASELGLKAIKDIDDGPMSIFDTDNKLEPESNGDGEQVFFRVTDASKAFNQLTLVGEKPSLKDVDFLVQTFTRAAADQGAADPLVVPSGATLSEPWTN